MIVWSIKMLTNNFSFCFQNGYTALIRAIVFNQCEIADLLMTERPSLKDIPDNVCIPLTLKCCGYFHPNYKDAKIFEKHLNPVMLVFTGYSSH